MIRRKNKCLAHDQNNQWKRTSETDSIHALKMSSYIHTLHSSRHSFPKQSKLPSAQAELKPTAVPVHQNVLKHQDEVFRCVY